MMKPSTFDSEVSTNGYWQDVFCLLSDVGAYARAEKLDRNLNSDENRHAVWAIFVQYYKGDFGRLHSTIANRRRECLDDIRTLNARMRGLGLGVVEVPEYLLYQLLDADRRQKYKRLAEKHWKKQELVPLDELEREYQNPRPRR